MAASPETTEHSFIEPVPEIQPAIAVSVELGAKLRKAGAVLEIDPSGITDILNNHLTTKELQQTTVVFDQPSHVHGGHYYSGILGDKKAISDNTIRLNLHPTHVNGEDEVGLSDSLAHEGQHARDFEDLGHKRARRQYRLWSFGIGATALNATFIPSVVNFAIINPDAPVDTANVSFVAINSVVALISGLAAGYFVNPFEVRARRAGRAQQTRPSQPLVHLRPIPTVEA